MIYWRFDKYAISMSSRQIESRLVSVEEFQAFLSWTKENFFLYVGFIIDNEIDSFLLQNSKMIFSTEFLILLKR